MMRGLFLALAILVSQQAAHAGALYSWVNNEDTHAFGTLELSDAAYFAGGTSGTIQPYEGQVWFNGHAVAPSPLTVQFSLGTGSINIAPPWNPFVPPDGFPNASLRIAFDLSVIGDGLAGFMRYGDGYDEFWMNGTADAWGNFKIASDLHPFDCLPDTPDACDAFGGRWVLMAAPAGVPEPVGAGLFLAGLIGLGLMHRRRSSQSDTL